MGVFPVPPTVIFPIDITGIFSEYVFNTPKSYRKFLKDVKIPNKKAGTE